MSNKYTVHCSCSSVIECNDKDSEVLFEDLLFYITTTCPFCDKEHRIRISM